jgi:hypothetical protein
MGFDNLESRILGSIIPVTTVFDGFVMPFIGYQLCYPTYRACNLSTPSEHSHRRYRPDISRRFTQLHVFHHD